MLAQDPPQLGPYTVVRPLGRGGMAVVYLCERQGIGGFRKQVVAKLIRPEHASNDDFVLMFLDEARLSATLSHPNVVHVYEVATVNGAPYLVMEYVHGPSLCQLARRAQAAMHYGHLAYVVAAIGRGLHHAHFGDAPGGPDTPARIVHRDVSVQNILVATDGTPKLIDFGIARAEGRLHETGPGWKGKVSYVSPEQVLEDPVDYRCDIFALGVCLYRATTGQMPFNGETVADTVARVVAGTPPRPSSLVPGYPPALEAIVDRALARIPDRYPTAAAMAADLEAFYADGDWSSDARGVSAWIHALFPNGSEDWLGAPSAERVPTPTPTASLLLDEDTDAGGTIDPTPVVIAAPTPRRDPSVESGLVMIAAIGLLTLIAASSLLALTLALLWFEVGAPSIAPGTGPARAAAPEAPPAD